LIFSLRSPGLLESSPHRPGNTLIGYLRIIRYAQACLRRAVIGELITMSELDHSYALTAGDNQSDAVRILSWPEGKGFAWFENPASRSAWKGHDMAESTIRNARDRP